MRSGIDVWRSPGWHAGAVAWLDEQLDAAGARRTGRVKQPHLRPWATVLTAPTTLGRVWLKAAGPGTAFEVGLYELLARVVPERVLIPIAVDTERAWLLLPNGGPALADRLANAALAAAFAAILQAYGQLQRDLAAHVDAALDLGVADMRPGVMPQRFDEALAAVGGDAAHEVAGLRGTFASWCERLGGAPGGASLDHNDLHPWNMLVARLERPQDVRFYDWGDTVVAHPFACMLVPLGWVARSVGHEAVDEVRDAYLETFADLAPHAELVETLELACRVAKVARALTWHRAVSISDPAEVDARFARAPLETLRSLLDDSYLGGA